ncbi:MAG TPA: FtsW/RodA/SpoVE family cell cycle protein [Bacteroidia bacterium]|nr:FtsW/RodA/SpoVE family cell cycle protein [Bacteroidia bacterium]HRG53568.1 FtsW/RodA/SpoVE family cell cycle protein [Bacteroidia bacterium]
MNVLKYIKGDLVIWIVVILLSLISIFVVYSSVVALAYRYKGGDTTSYLIKHIFIVASGIFLMYLIHKVKYSYFSRISQIAIFVAAPLLLYTLLKGVSAGEASRWLAIPGTSLTFQTSDFAKLALITYVARVLSIKQDVIKDFKQGFLPIIIPAAVICALILPANFSTAALLFLTCMILMFIGRMNTKHLLILVGSGIVLGALFFLLIWNYPTLFKRGETWKARIENFSNGDAESNFQAEQAKIAIAKGKVLGVGPGNSLQRNFLPQAASDFIYAIVIEEWGLIAAVCIVFLYVILLFRGVRIAIKTERTFGSLLAIGLSISLVFQAMVNMAVAVNLFPVTGQPLPLISMGGTSIWFTSIAIGIILSVSRETDAEQKEGGHLEAA